MPLCAHGWNPAGSLFVLQWRQTAGVMPEMQDLDRLALFVHAVVDVKGSMKQPVDLRSLLQGCAEIWEVWKQIETAEEIMDKALGGAAVLFYRPGQNSLELA